MRSAPNASGTPAASSTTGVGPTTPPAAPAIFPAAEARGQAAKALPKTPATSAAAVAGKAEKEIPLDSGLRPATGSTGADAKRLAGWFFGMVLKLGLVLVLAYASLAVVRRFLPGGAAAAPGKELGIRRTIALGAGRSVHLLDVEGRQILIGATPQQINLLADLTDPVLPSGDEDAVTVPRALAEGTFRAHLSGLLAGASAPAGDAGGAAARAAKPAPSQPDTYSDDELRAEMRRHLFAMNRSAAGLAGLSAKQPGGD